ncbi:MFS general substrate transporter [Trichoderma ceciliae]
MTSPSRSPEVSCGDELPVAVESSNSEQTVEIWQTRNAQDPEARVTAMPAWRFWLLCFGVCPGLLLSIMDSSILATSLYTIGVEFQEHSLINWVVLTYTLGYTGFTVPSSILSDVVGRRNAFVAPYILFLSFSMACGCVQNVKQLIICRAFQGIGGSGLYALSILLLTQQSPPHLRQYIGSIIGVVIASAGILGPILGGLFTQYASWRWIFWIKWFAHSIVSVFPVTLFRSRLYARSILTTLFIGFPHLLLIFSFPIRMQVVSGRSPLVAGLTLLPMLGTVALGSMVSGKMNALKNNLADTMRCGTCFMALGCGLLTTVRGSKDDAKALGFLAFAGFGFGLCTAAATNVIGVEVPIRQRASAHGILAQARILGGSLGVSASTVFLHTEVIHRLADILTSEELASFEGNIKNVTGDSSEAVQSAYVSVFHKSLQTATIMACIAVLSTFYGSRIFPDNIKQRRETTISEETDRGVMTALAPLQNVAQLGTR